jgi:hypothetical protein
MVDSKSGDVNKKPNYKMSNSQKNGTDGRAAPGCERSKIVENYRRMIACSLKSEAAY